MSYPTETEGLPAQAEAEATGASGTRSAHPSAPPVLELRPSLAVLPEGQSVPSSTCVTCPSCLAMRDAEGPSLYCRITHSFTWRAGKDNQGNQGEQWPLLDCDMKHLPPEA